MVKKIRLIDEPVDAVQESKDEFNAEILELAKTMDWKLWEILQTVKRLEEQMNDKMDKGT
jgi:hypothetical protein|tara:strand:+ start:6548 stop:6727 length:180 start_codon:yes stop_codon:yes gene_type:complete